LQGDLEKRESVNQQVDPLVKQLEEIEKEIASVRSEISQKEHK
ncbi:SE1832 family protein, partial [Staphylococcus hominis]